MSRDGSGNYTLPLADVTDGTTIEPTWANPTLDDIESELTDSLDRNGRGGMTSAFQNLDGTEDLPGIAFTLEPDSGVYRSGTNEMRAVVAGQDVARWFDDTATGAGSQRPFEIWDGSAFFSPINPASPGSLTFGNVTCDAAVTAGNAFDVTGDLTADTAAITGDSDFGSLVGSIEAFTNDISIGLFNAASAARLAYYRISTNGSKTATGTYTVTVGAAPGGSGTHVVVVIPALGTSRRRAFYEYIGASQIRVKIVDIDTNSLVDSAFCVLTVTS